MRTTNHIFRTIVSATALSFVAAGFASALEPIGSVVQVHPTMAGDQEMPDVAILDDGRAVVVWSSPGVDAGSNGVVYSLLDESGSIGGEVLVNADSPLLQYQPSVVPYVDGGFLVAWASDTVADSLDIFAQQFDSAGAKTGPTEFRMNAFTSNLQTMPALATFGSNIVGAWETFGHDGSHPTASEGVGIRFYSSPPTPMPSGEMIPHLGEIVDGYQGEPDIALSPFDDVVVVWTSEAGDSDDSGILAQRYNRANGLPLGPNFVVNSLETSTQDQARVAIDSNGGFVVVWRSLGADGSDFGIRARLFTFDGIPRGPEFAVNTTTDQAQQAPDVAMLPDGRFVVVWASNELPGQNRIRAQFFGPLGDKIGAEVLVNLDFPSIRGNPKVAIRGLRAIVVWEDIDSPPSSRGIGARWYSVPGAQAAPVAGPKIAGKGKKRLVLGAKQSLVLLRGTATAAAGLERIEAKVGKRPYRRIGKGPSWRLRVAAPKRGRLVVLVRAKDKAGKVSAPLRYTILKRP